MAFALALLSASAIAGKPAGNQPPTVSLTAPTSGATYAAPATIALAASATDANGTISKVEFYAGTTLLGSDTAAPYSLAWSNVPAGNYVLTAKAYDNAGATATSAGASVTVTGGASADLVVTNPSAGAIVTSQPHLAVSGTFVGPSNSTVLVSTIASSVVATVSGNTFSASVPISLGDTLLTVRLSRPDRTSATVLRPITVAKGIAAFVAPNSTQVTVGEPVRLAVDARITDGTPVQQVDFALYRGGALVRSLGSATQAPFEITWIPDRVSLSDTVVARLSAAAGYDAVVFPTESTFRVDGPNMAPVVSLTTPLNGATFAAPASLTLAATATDSDGSIALVEFAQNGVVLGVTNVAPFHYLWTNVAAGAYALTATATDNRGASTTSGPVIVAVSDNAPPAVSLTSPAAGAGFVAPAAVALAANASDSDGTIAKVDFHQGATLIGTSTTAPYSFLWSNVQAGTYTLTASATDNLGASSTTAAVTVSVAANNVPTVSLTSPAAASSYIAPADIVLAATAADNDGSVAKVDFYAGSSLLGTATTAPYTVTWVSAPAGNFTLTAKATDNLGATTTSTGVAISVTNTPPTASLTSPSEGSTTYSGGTLTLSAAAADADGSIVKVDFYQGTTLLGTATQAPYSLPWSNIAPGVYTLYVVATDNAGATTQSAPFTLTVLPNVLPAVILTAPAGGASFAAGSDVKLAANALDSDGSIAKVDFYHGTTLLGTTSSAPYAVTWSKVPAGNYLLTAKATDNAGGTTTSAAIDITVNPPSLTFAAPLDGATVSGQRVLAGGSFQALPNSGITINGVVAAQSGGNFYADLPLVAGANTLTARLTTAAGEVATQTIVVTSDGVAPTIQIAADRLEGLAPLTVKFTVRNTDSTPATVQIDGGTGYNVPAGGTTNLNWAISTPGAYPITFTATDAAGLVTRQDFVLVAHDAAAMDQLFKALWSGMTDALVAGDKATAMSALSRPAQQKFGPVFDLLMPSYAQIAASFSELQRGSLSAEIGEYVINRVIGGNDHAFFIYFLRGTDGCWRLDSM